MNGQFDIGDLTPTKYFFSIAIVLGLLFAMISGDSDKPIIFVFLQWQLQTIVPMALLIGMHILLLKNQRFTRLNPWIALLISGVLATTVFSPIALTIDSWLEPTNHSKSYLIELFDEWCGVTPPITICWIALNVPWLLGYRLEKNDIEEKQSTTSNLTEQQVLSTPDFMALLPPEKQGKLIFLKSELHYLQVVTDKGNSLILYNLSDAISQLSPESGMSVHRSYWVAFDAIQELTKKGRQGTLILKNSQKIPVSRGKLKLVGESLEI